MSNLPEGRPFKAGVLGGTIYTYAEIGDELPVHAHDVGSNHITIVMHGAFRCIGNPQIEGKILTPGNVAVWPVRQPHGFVALEPNSRMLQIRTA